MCPQRSHQDSILRKCFRLRTRPWDAKENLHDLP